MGILAALTYNLLSVVGTELKRTVLQRSHSPPKKVVHLFFFSQVNKCNLHGCIKFCRRCIYVIINEMNNSVCTLQKCLQQNFGRIN